MDWSMLILGLVLGSCVTTGLVWSQQRAGALQGDGYFSRVALSVVLTSLFIGGVTMAIEYATTRTVTSGRPLFATGWLLGGLIGGWLITGPMRRT